LPHDGKGNLTRSREGFATDGTDFTDEIEIGFFCVFLIREIGAIYGSFRLVTSAATGFG
jgi:hypothetical protein